MSQIFLTPEEREQLQGMNQEQASGWLKHRINVDYSPKITKAGITNNRAWLQWEAPIQRITQLDDQTEQQRRFLKLRQVIASSEADPEILTLLDQALDYIIQQSLLKGHNLEL